MSELSDLRVMIQGSRFEGWIPLVGTWAHPQWRPSALSFLFPFLPLMVMYLPILLMFFARFRMQSYGSEDLDTNLYEEKYGFE